MSCIEWPWINSADPNLEWMADIDLWIAAPLNPMPPTSVVEENGIPGWFMLSQNYPNPFNPATTFEFSVPAKSIATLKVFTVSGEELAALFPGESEPGRVYRATFGAASLPSGLYLARLDFGLEQSIRKMILMK